MWTKDDLTRLKRALKKYPDSSDKSERNQRWKDISKYVGGGHDKRDCYQRHKESRQGKSNSNARPQTSRAGGRGNASWGDITSERDKSKVERKKKIKLSSESNGRSRGSKQVGWGAPDDGYSAVANPSVGRGVAEPEHVKKPVRGWGESSKACNTRNTVDGWNSEPKENVRHRGWGDDADVEESRDVNPPPVRVGGGASLHNSRRAPSNEMVVQESDDFSGDFGASFGGPLVSGGGGLRI